MRSLGTTASVSYLFSSALQSSQLKMCLAPGCRQLGCGSHLQSPDARGHTSCVGWVHKIPSLCGIARSGYTAGRSSKMESESGAKRQSCLAKNMAGSGNKSPVDTKGGVQGEDQRPELPLGPASGYSEKLTTF